jgi:hypothetical protein
MIETSQLASGTFRIRSTGFVNCAPNQTSGGNCVTQRIVATFKRASFLDYVYFTQLETSDPVTYGNTTTINGAYQQCTKTIAQGRYNAPIPNSGGQYCDVISFIDGEQINGPVHTNDALVICGRPTFGRTASDPIEVSSPPKGWFSNCSSWSDQPIFKGTFITNAPVLTPPPTNTSLSNVPGALVYTGQTKIVFNGTNMTVTNNGSTSTVPIPASGIIYIKNGACSSAYNPYTATYPTTSTCGNALVSGTYSGQLTVAAENDVIIEDDVLKSTSNTTSMLGLIANNFVRVKHPICASTDLGCTNGTKSAETAKGVCNNGVNGTGSNANLRIDAAILAISHSFIVDHYDCGADLGTLTVNGAISQKFRGAVGQYGGYGGGRGYDKNYNYDDRLRYISPPHYLDPLQSGWHMQRQTLDP